MENGRINTLSGALRYYRLVAGAENKSPQTIIWVGTAGKQLQEFLGEDILLKDLNASHLRNFIGFLKGRGRYLTHPCRRPSEKGLSAETLNAYVRALRAFSTFLNREGVIETNVFAVVKPPKVPRRQLVPLSESQLKRLLALPDRSTYNGFLDHILICFLLDTLARVNEVVTLEVENIDLEQGYAKVMCKGSKENILPFSPRLVALMARYVSRYRPDSGSPYVFLTKNGRRLTANMIEKRLRAYGERLGFKVRPHLLRHSGAVLMLKSGMDAFSLQKMLGHSSLATTQIYVHLASSDLQIAHRRAGVLEKLIG